MKCNTGSLKKFEEEATIRDGSEVLIRPLRAADEGKILAFFRGLTEESKWRRFFSPVKDGTLVLEAKRESDVDCDERFGLIATIEEDTRVVGHAFYVRLSDTHADAAFTVADEYQGRGLGTLMLLRLAEFAMTKGVRVFEADVMASNQQMINVFRNAGFRIKTKVETGVLHIEFPIDDPGPYQKNRRKPGADGDVRPSPNSPRQP